MNLNNWKLVTVTSILTAAAALVACGGGGEPSAEDQAVDAFRDQKDMLNDGQYGRLYDELHPGQQAVITRDHFVSCYSAVTFPHIEVLDIEDVYQEEMTPLDVPTSTSTAITVRMKMTLGDETSEEVDTFHEYDVDGRWVWVLADAAAAPMKAGQCP